MHAFKPTDHLRHPPGPDGRMRDSLFWQTVIAEERLCFQTYLFLTAEGKAGLNIALWGGEDEKFRCAEFQQGEIPATMDLDDFAFEGFRLNKVAFGGPAKVAFSGKAQGRVRVHRAPRAVQLSQQSRWPALLDGGRPL